MNDYPSNLYLFFSKLQEKIIKPLYLFLEALFLFPMFLMMDYEDWINKNRLAMGRNKHSCNDDIWCFATAVFWALIAFIIFFLCLEGV